MEKAKKGIPLAMVFAFIQVMAWAQPQLQAKLSATSIKPGDSLLFEAAASGGRAKFSTLHVVLESVDHQHIWRLRYPILEGVASGALFLPDTFPRGQYAMNFLWQAPGIHLMGQVLDKKPPKQINCLAKASNKEVMAKTISVDEEGYFQVPNLLFERQATFVFSPIYKVYANSMEVAIETPVDSAFKPLATATLFLGIGEPLDANAASGYSYNDEEGNAGGTLKAVIITGKKKTPIDDYKDKYVRGLFENDGIEFDGLGDFDFSSYGTAAEVISGRVPSLQVYLDRINVEGAITIRGYEPAFFVDEMQTDYEGVLSIPTSQIAMIKVFRPPFMGTPMGSAGGAVAIYTKRGKDGSRLNTRNRFVVNGYTPQEYVLQ